MKPKFRVPASKLGAFADFVALLKSKNATSFFERAPIYIFQNDCNRWIISAFLWDEMPEGERFWSAVDSEWMKKLEKSQ